MLEHEARLAKLEEEDRGGSGSGRLGGIFGDSEGMSPHTNCGCDPNVCTMDVMNRPLPDAENPSATLGSRLSWLLSDLAGDLKLDSPIDACIKVCHHDFPTECDDAIRFVARRLD